MMDFGRYVGFQYSSNHDGALWFSMYMLLADSAEVSDIHHQIPGCCDCGRYFSQMLINHDKHHITLHMAST